MFKEIEMNEVQLFIYYQFIKLIQNPNEMVVVEFEVDSAKYLNTLFQVNLLLNTELTVVKNKAYVEINGEIVKRLIVLAGKYPELIKAL